MRTSEMPQSNTVAKAPHVSQVDAHRFRRKNPKAVRRATGTHKIRSVALATVMCAAMVPDAVSRAELTRKKTTIWDPLLHNRGVRAIG